jgi:hypothetical protein
MKRMPYSLETKHWSKHGGNSIEMGKLIDFFNKLASNILMVKGWQRSQKQNN